MEILKSALKHQWDELISFWWFCNLFQAVGAERVEALYPYLCGQMEQKATEGFVRGENTNQQFSVWSNSKYRSAAVRV